MSTYNFHFIQFSVSYVVDVSYVAIKANLYVFLYIKNFTKKLNYN